MDAEMRTAVTLLVKSMASVSAAGCRTLSRSPDSPIGIASRRGAFASITTGVSGVAGCAEAGVPVASASGAGAAGRPATGVGDADARWPIRPRLRLNATNNRSQIPPAIVRVLLLETVDPLVAS